MRILARILSIFALAVLAPSMAYAQASIAGVVRDTSGAVLPGVTVEAASPVLIEKVRTVVTDGAGQYRIIDLRPGDYTVTFTLPGFNTVKREGILLQGTFAATVNADLRVGALEETITVTGAAPVVDIQSVRQQSVMDREAIRDLPTSRHYATMAALVPGLNVPQATESVGGSGLLRGARFSSHGGRESDTRLMLDGLSTASLTGGTFASEHVQNMALAQELTLVTSGGLGEAETAGVVLNVVPREGGNTIRGSWFTNFANGAMQGSNLTDELRKSVPSPNAIKKVWEVSPTVGGPILQDKLWYLFNYRHSGTRRTVVNRWYNKNANDPTKWLYEPDFSQDPIQDQTLKDVAGRLTWQVSQRNKINVFWDEQEKRDGFVGVQAVQGFRAPDGDLRVHTPVNRLAQASWSSPMTNRLLLEAAVGHHYLRVGHYLPPDWNPALIGVVEQAGILPGLEYREVQELNGAYPNVQGRVAASYVTGSHTAKVGYVRTRFHTDTKNDTHQAITYRLNNGVPNQLTLKDGRPHRDELAFGDALYAQDSWVIGRLTLQGGVRYEHQTMFFPSVAVGFSRFIPNGFHTAPTDGMKWHDITPRVAGGFDLTGDGKTALRFTLGKFVSDIGTGGFQNMRPASRLATQTTRSWNDANRDYVPDCDLLNPVANGECGAFADARFGQNILTRFYDENLVNGWGKRPFNWEFSTSLQREVLPGVGVNVGYFRRSYGNFAVTDNRAVTVADFNTFGVPVPADPRLPGGGGGVLTGLYNVVPAKFGQTDDFVTHAKNFGEWTERWNGVDVNVNARSVKGVTLSGGLSTGRRTENFCDLRANFPEIGPLNPYCATQEPFLTQVKGQGTYTIPRIDVLVSGTFQSNPGVVLAANSNVPNAVIAPSLGRNLSGGAANVAVNLAEPGSLYGDRTNQVDLRIAKVLTYGRTRTNVGIDLYNALNASPVLSYNQTFSPTWPLPLNVMPARFLKVGFEVNF